MLYNYASELSKKPLSSLDKEEKVIVRDFRAFNASAKHQILPKLHKREEDLIKDCEHCEKWKATDEEKGICEKDKKCTYHFLECEDWVKRRSVFLKKFKGKRKGKSRKR